MTGTESMVSLFFTLALMVVLLYFMIYRPQKKQEKKDAAMRNSLEIGDQVTTIGGVIGRVVAIKDDTFVLETGSDRVKIPLHQDRHRLGGEAETWTTPPAPSSKSSSKK